MRHAAEAHRTIGREAELSAVEELLDAAAENFAALVLEGEAGIGKTTVWRDGVRVADRRGFRVLACRPAQAEAKLAFSGLADLLEPVPQEVVAALADPQRQALDVALLRAAPGEAGVDQRVVCTAVRSLLIELSSQEPTLVAIDDVQWLDSASAAVLAFVLRRLGPEPIGFLATRRLGERSKLNVDEHTEAAALTRATIGPLTMAGVHHLLAQRLGAPFPRSALVRVHETSGGNPLFALEIGRVLLEEGIPPAGEPLPVPRDVRTLVRRRVSTLPPATREVLLAAASLAAPREETLRAALRRAVDDDLARAERADVAALEGEMVSFSHPLYAAAIYASASAADRRGMHSRLAQVLDDDEQRARHLALAVDGRDEQTAAAVHAAARATVLRGSPTAAAELAELALRLGEAATDVEAGRLVDLAEYYFLAGQPDRAREAIEGVASWDAWPPALRARALGLLVELVYWTETSPRAAEVGEQLLAASLPIEVRAHVHAALAGVYEFDFARSTGHADAAVALLEQLGEHADPAAQAMAYTMQLRGRVFLGQGLDRSLVDRVLEAEARLPPEQAHVQISGRLGQWFKYVDDLDTSREWLERHLQKAIDEGDEVSQLSKLMHLAVTECWAGDLETALRHATVACDVDDKVGPRPGGPYATRALVEAHVGNAAGVQAVAKETGWSIDAQPHVIQLQGALGLLALSIEDYDEADRHLSLAVALAEQARIGEPGVHRVHADAAEAAIVVGDLERAERLAAYLDDHGTRTHHRWSLATGARVRAMLAAARGRLDEASADVERALDHHARLPMPFEHARTLLVKGVLERRARRRANAKRSFDEALEIFGRIGARLWVERAQRELDRVGLRRRSAHDELTEGERRVAELAAQGLTNREVAAILYMSPKTVSANLSRVYRKLGIHSRAELGALMADRVQT